MLLNLIHDGFPRSDRLTAENRRPDPTRSFILLLYRNFILSLSNLEFYSKSFEVFSALSLRVPRPEPR